MDDEPKVVLLHGLGETPKAWARVLEHVPHIDALTPELFTSVNDRGWSLDGATDELAATLEEPVDVVGLSLGAVIGLNLAMRHPHLVRSLFLSAPQSNPPQRLMRAQRFIMSVLPSRLVCPPGLSKAQLLTVLDDLSTMNLDPGLSHLHMPTTVACGAKDRANLPAARSIGSHIPHAQLVIVPGAGHQWHLGMPAEFAAALTTHLDR